MQQAELWVRSFPAKHHQPAEQIRILFHLLCFVQHCNFLFLHPKKAPRERRPEEIERDRAEGFAKDRGWGGVARKGAVHLKSTGQEMKKATGRPSAPAPMAQWIEDSTPSRARSTSTKAKAPYTLPTDIAADVRKAFLGTATQREKMVAFLTRAAEAYDRHRYEEALRLGRIVSDAVPGVAAVRELTGLAAYRAQRWNMARIHLQAHFVLTDEEQHLPLIMDCDRANRKWRLVEKVFAQLEEHRPTAEVLTEGRIVLAGAWSDQRKYSQAIDLLVRAGGTKNLKNPSDRHIRLWYALADLFDRAGDAVSARELFARIALVDPEAYDVSARLEELGSGAPRKQRKRRATPQSKKRVD